VAFKYKWAVGVTTAPRAADTLTATVFALKNVGWDSINVFAEPDSVLSENVKNLCNIVQHKTKKGVNGNWVSGFSYLMEKNADADFILMCQDDTLYAHNLREYLEETCPVDFEGFFTLYTGHRGWKTAGFSNTWLVHRCSMQRGGQFAGALGLVFPNAIQNPPRSSAKLLYAFMQEQNYGPEDRHIDTKLGYWLATKNMPLRYHLPSLCDHTGALCSTLYIPEAIRKAFRFTGNVKDVE